MMGFLFFLLVAAAAWVVFCAVVRPFRRWLPFALVPSSAALLAFGSCWGLAVSLERAFGENAGGTGFFAGYVIGGIVGAGAGFAAARRALAGVAAE